MTRNITISDEVYSALAENAQNQGLEPDALAEKLLSKAICGEPTSWYQSFRNKMLNENPELSDRTEEEIVREFDRLSSKIAKDLHFRTLEENENGAGRAKLRLSR